MLTLDSGSVSLSRSARGDSVQTIWLACRHSDPFTLDTTVLRCVKVAPLGMFFLAYLLDTYILIFEGCASWSHDLSVLAFVSWLAWHSIGCVDSGISATFSFQKVIVYIGVESALLVLDCTQSLACVTCCIQKGQDVRMNNFFCVNTFLRCGTVSSPMLTINSCRAIRLRHVLHLSDCPTSFTLLISTLPLLVMFYASTPLAIRYQVLQLLLATWCLHQVAVLPVNPQIFTLLPVMHDLLPIVYFFNYFEFIF